MLGSLSTLYSCIHDIYDIHDTQTLSSILEWYAFQKYSTCIPDICQERQERRGCKIFAWVLKKFQKSEKITVLGKYVVNLRTFRV